MNADTELNASLGRQAGVALGHAFLHLDRVARRVDDAAKLDEAAIADAVDNAPMMRGDCGINQIVAQPSQARQRSLLVCPDEPAEPTTSATRIAAIFRVSLIARPSVSVQVSTRRNGLADLVVEMLIWVGGSARENRAGLRKSTLPAISYAYRGSHVLPTSLMLKEERT
jgi:hypothetical protein